MNTLPSQWTGPAAGPNPHVGFTTILFKHKQLVLTVFATVVLAGIFYILLAQPKYESESEVVVKFGNQVADVDHQQITELTPSDRREIVLSHASILESRDLTEATINDIGLKALYPDIAAHPPARWTAMDEATKRFKQNLWVDVGAQNNVISVSFTHPDKAMAQKVVRRLLYLYNTQQTSVYHDPHSDFLKAEVEQAHKNLSGSQTALEEFKDKWQISDYDEEVDDLLKQRGDISNNLHEAKANLLQAQRRKSEIENLLRTVPERLPESPNGEKYRSLDDAQSRLADLRTKRSQMLATYNPDSPILAALNAGLAAAEADVRQQRNQLQGRASANINTVHQTVQTDYLHAVADAEGNAEPVQVLTTALADVDQRITDLRKARTTFADFSREEQLSEDIYRSLSTQYEDARVKDNINEHRISSVATISSPSMPYRAAYPRRLLTLLASILAGGLLAVAGAMILEAWDDRFTTADQMAIFLGIPVLASFPRPGESSTGRALVLYGAT